MTPSSPVPVARVAARGRPGADPACAGCALLGIFRALRRAGLDVQGAPGCDPGPTAALARAPGRWAAVLAARAVLADPVAALDAAWGAGARVVVVADDRRAGAPEAVEAALATAG